MNEDLLNIEIRKLLKIVGITSQREIEIAVRNAVASGKLTGNETLDVKMTLELSDIDLKHSIEGAIALE